MSPLAVVDSVVLIAAMHRRDANHPGALPILKAADDGTIPPLVLTDFILAETLNYLTRKGGSSAGREALRRLESSRGFRVERISDAAFARAKTDVFGTIEGLSFVDALTVAYMFERGHAQLYSFDAGFDRVPGIARLVAVPG